MEELLEQFTNAEIDGNFHLMDDIMEKVAHLDEDEYRKLQERRDFVYSNGTEKQLSEPHENE